MAAQSRKRSRPAPKRRPGGNPQKAHRPAPRAATPATARDWIGAARLRTLPLAITPVLIGTGAATLVDDQLHWVIALACLAVAFALQIGVNYANDYSDGIRGPTTSASVPGDSPAAGRRSRAPCSSWRWRSSRSPRSSASRS